MLHEISGGRFALGVGVGTITQITGDVRFPCR
jgi:alkanesulfonate monooxygenase SsuD/methylene tetrahydromethanopterin reductase-like flavin-dependent oxidoreductase (luciferase family)